MKKNIAPLFAALIVTAILGLGMFFIGKNAMNASAATINPSAISSETAAQLQEILVTFQTREIEYQNKLTQATTEVNTANEQLAVANQQILEYEHLLQELQNSGVITIAADGTVSVTVPSEIASQGQRGQGGNH